MTIEDLSARLEKVERESRRMKAGGVLFLVAAAAAAAMGQAAAPPKVIRAGSFEVVDRKGEVIAGFGRIMPEPTDPPDVPALWMYRGDTRTLSAMLSVQRGGYSNLFLEGPDWRIQLGGLTEPLEAAKKESPAGLSVSRPYRMSRVALAASEDGSPFLALKDGALNEAGAALGAVTIRKPSGEGEERTGVASLVLLDKDGKVLFRAPQ